jgi:hypothetical protein
MRHLLCILLIASCSVAAPLPKTVDPRFADLWAKMQDPNPVMAAVSAYRLSKITGCDKFLLKHLQPVKTSRAEMDALLKKLNDGDEESTAEALKEMTLFDPRLTHSCAEQVAMMKSDEKLLKLVGVWTAAKIEDGAVLDRSTLKVNPEPTSDKFGSLQFTVRHPKTGISGMATSIAPPEKIYNPTLWQHRLALGVLKASKTSESEALLKAIADGHERSAITVRAKQLMEPAKLPESTDIVLSDLQGYEPTMWLDLMFALEQNPKRLLEVARKLPTLNLDADKTEALMKQLDSEDDAVWRKAMKALAYHQPMVHFDIPSISAKLTTGKGRGRFHEVQFGKTETDDQQAFDSITIDKDKMLVFATKNLRNLSPYQPIEEFLPWTWRSYVLLAPVLEQVGSDDAKGVLKAWSGGHGKILPTRAAKEALKRLEEK